MAQHLRKPDWLKIRLGGNEQFTETKSIVDLIAFTQYAQVDAEYGDVGAGNSYIHYRW